MAKRPSDYRAAWDALKEEAAALAAHGSTLQGLPPDHPSIEEQEAGVAVLAAKQDAVAHEVWLTTAGDLADLLLLAEVVWTYFWGLGTFPQLPADIEDKDQREVAVAYLVRGVWDAQSQAQAAGAGGGKP